MTFEEKNKKIAECCNHKSKGGYYWNPPRGYCVDPMDYCGDLNACYEMEATLTIEEHSLFREFLAQLVNFNGLTLSGARDYISSTAEQRAEAFGKVKKLW